MKSIVKNELLLQPTTDITFMEELIVIREEQVTKLFNMLNPSTNLKCPVENVTYSGDSLKYIWGWKGTGKTTMLRWFEKQIQSIERRTIFINCRFSNNPGQLIDEIYKKLREIYPNFVPKSEYTRMQIGEYIRQIKDMQLFLFLDEIDKPLRNSKSDQKDEFLHFIIRLVSENTQNNFKVVFTTNVINIERMLSEEVISYLGANKIIFAVYTVPQIVNILEKRAANAIISGTYDKKDLLLIAQITYNSFDGDIRTALDMLHKAAKRADGKLDIQQVDKIVQVIECNILRTELYSLPRGVRLLLTSLVQNVITATGVDSDKVFTTEEIYTIYSNFCQGEGYKIAQRAMFYRYLNSLIDAFILTRQSTGLKLVESPVKLNSCLQYHV